MTIVASVRQTAPLRADLSAATAALAHIAGRAPQLNHSSSINKTTPDSISLLRPRRSTKQPIISIRRHTARAAPRSKSP